MTDDELTGIFDDLTPQDFMQPRMTFERFVDDNIAAVRADYLSAKDDLMPVAVFATDDNKWAFEPTDEETLGQYLERLRTVGKSLQAKWFFITRLTLVAAYETEDEVPDPASPEAMEALAEAGGALQEGLVYYAAQVENGKRTVRHGVMFVEDGRLGRTVEANPNAQGLGVFSKILS